MCSYTGVISVIVCELVSDILRTVYTTVVPVVPIPRLQTTVFSKVCDTVSRNVSVFLHVNY